VRGTATFVDNDEVGFDMILTFSNIREASCLLYWKDVASVKEV